MLGRCPDGDDVAGVVGHAQSVPAPTLVRLTSSRSRVPEGEALELTAEVSTVLAGAFGGGGAPTGTVVFRLGDRVLGTVPLDPRGRAVVGGIRLPAGINPITAWYGGDPAHARATSPPLPQAVTGAAAPVVLLVSAPVPVGAGVRLEAELVDPQTGRLAEDATGSLVFRAGGGTVARADLVGGLARAVVGRLPAGRLLAEYVGDAEHAPATGGFPDPA